MGHSTPRRLVRVVRATLLASLVVALATGSVRAAPRAPQVHVNGTGLQSYLDHAGENIDVQTAQVDAELLHGDSSYTIFNGNTATTVFLQVELIQHASATALGMYGGHDGVASLIPVFPDASGPGWFAVASFRWSPTRVIVSVFDDLAAFRGSSTYLGADRFGVGFYLATAHATYFSQDWLNHAGEARCLFYAGTGINSGAWWVAWEDGDPPADNDFDDSILFIEGPVESPGFTAAQRTTWGALKARFR